MKDKITALVLGVVMLTSATLLAGQVEKSRIYQQSRVLRAVFDEESVGLAEMLTDRRNVSMLTNFAVAVTGAYINFELIPVHEAQTFGVIFDSLGDEVEIDQFEYRGKDLILHGAATWQDYEEFVARLQDRDYFRNVSCEYIDSGDGMVRFKIVLVSAYYREVILPLFI